MDKTGIKKSKKNFAEIAGNEAILLNDKNLDFKLGHAISE